MFLKKEIWNTFNNLILCDLIRIFGQFITDKTVQISIEHVVLICDSYKPSISHSLYGTVI